MISFGKGFGNDLYMGDDSLTETYTSMKPTEGLRSTELTTLAKIEQRQESGRTVIEIDTPLSKSQFEKVKKVIASTKQKPVGEEASKLEQIEDFLRRHKTFHDVPVKDMRHIIPLFLMEVYVEKYGQYTKKVKGLWEKRPGDWPENVPFVDPNNRLKNEGEKKNVKPKKELLGQMLTYLVDRYTKMKSAAEASDGYLLHVNDPMLNFPHQSSTQYDDHCLYELDLVETNDVELRAAEQSVSDQSLSTGHNSGFSSLPGYSFVFHQNVKPSLSSVTNDGSMIHSSLSTLEDPLSGAVDVELGGLVEDGPCMELQWAKQPDLDARPPEQVVDNEEESSSEKDWKPLEDICERTRHKIGYMRMKVLVSKAMQVQLESIHGVLKNWLVSVSDDDDKLKLLEKWYELEKCLDGAKFQQSSKCSKMIQDLYDELIPKIVPLKDFMDNNTVKSKSMDLPIPAEDPQQINSLLNIRPRPGTAGGTVPFPHGNQLEVRYLTSVQSASNNGCGVSALSDNNKPIQLAQEDGEAQKSGKPEDNLVNMDELFCNFDDDDLKELLSSYWDPQGLSCPVQESAPATQSTLQVVGKLEMPVDPLQHVMTSVSVQPWGSANPPMMMSTPCFAFSSLPTVVPSQQISNASVGSPSTAFAEECFNRLSLSVNRDPSPQPVQRAHPCPPVQPNLDELLCKPRVRGRPGGKRSCPPMDEDDDLDIIVSGPSKPAKVPAYNMMIPLVVEEISNNLDKPFARVLKKKSCR